MVERQVPFALVTYAYRFLIMQDIQTALASSGEPPIPNISDLVTFDMPSSNMDELWATHLDKWSFQTEYLEKWEEMEETLGREMDAIIAPVSATAAVQHNQFKYYGYTNVFNLLDFTSVVVPVLFADMAIDKRDETHEPLSQMDPIVQAECESLIYGNTCTYIG
jgi:amidase